MPPSDADSIRLCCQLQLWVSYEAPLTVSSEMFNAFLRRRIKSINHLFVTWNRFKKKKKVGERGLYSNKKKMCFTILLLTSNGNPSLHQ